MEVGTLPTFTFWSLCGPFPCWFDQKTVVQLSFVVWRTLAPLLGCFVNRCALCHQSHHNLYSDNCHRACLLPEVSSQQQPNRSQTFLFYISYIRFSPKNDIVLLHFVSSHETKRTLTCQPLWCKDPAEPISRGLHLNMHALKTYALRCIINKALFSFCCDYSIYSSSKPVLKCLTL